MILGRRAKHEAWMRRALAVASESQTSADVPVGAVIIGPAGDELATGHNERERRADPTAHAEIIALRAAAAALGRWRLSDCTLVVTLEPCTMCAGALILARIGAVVFGAWEPKTGAVGSLYDVLRDPRHNWTPEVYAGLLEAECAALVRSFFPRADAPPAMPTPEFPASASPI